MSYGSYHWRAFTLASAVAALALPCVADEWSAQVGGRAQIDYASAEGDNSALDVNGSELRRARLNVSGKYGNILKYKAEFNTNSSGDINAEDIYLQWTPEQAGGWSIKAGQFKTPNSLDEQTSSRFISTLERAAFTDAFGFNRRVGIAVLNKGDNWTLTAGVFGKNLEDSSSQQGFALAGRATFTPVNTDGMLVHLGGSVRLREQGDTNGDIRYRQRPFTHLPGRIVSTGSIAGRDTFLGVEAAGIFDQAWVSGEYGLTNADCTAGTNGDPDLQGYYLEAGYFFGGRKTYKGGKFNRPKVDKPITDGGMGAVSLVARYDGLDLADASVNGGELDTLVLGIDWWPTAHTRVGLNYFNSDADLGTSTSGLDSNIAALVSVNTDSETVSGLVGRLQFDF